ncbi:MAG: four helix bundle protein [Acidobacteria bacterium]|nr:four helix bundle protein [Acidobacteriota bacterium]
MSENVVLEKSYKFAIRIVKLYKYLAEEKKEFVMSKSLLSRGTAIGERVKSAQEAESRAFFASDMGAALRNASATEFWLNLLRDSEFIDDRQHESMLADCLELIRLLTKITKTTDQNS